MPKLLTVTLALMMTPALLAIASASPCDSDGQPALGIVELPATLGKILYVDDRNAATGNGLWIYEETNGVYLDDPSHSIAPAHLQRGSTSGISFPSWDIISMVEPCVDPRPDGTDPDQSHY